ncbi:MAG: tetratricopeptide repeat protein [Spirochaetaceae bacterium]
MLFRARRAVVILLAVLSVPLPAQETEADPGAEGEPAWVTYRQGVHALNARDFGEALRSFRDALATRRPFPEAEAGLGRVFEADGNWELARRQYQRALELSDHFYVPQEEYVVRYRLADIHRNREMGKEYQRELEHIVEQNPQFAPDHDPEYRRLVPNVLTRPPAEDRPPEPRLDILLRLYRLDENFAFRAHRELGEVYLGSGRDTQAVRQLSFAAVAALSTLVEELRSETYGYEFSTTRRLIADALELERLRRYMGPEETDLFRVLFRLSGALLREDPTSEVPAQIWRLLGEFPDAAGEWAVRAARAIERPETSMNVDY